MRSDLRSNVKKAINKKAACSDLKKQRQKKRRKAQASLNNENVDPKKGANKALRAQILLDDFGLCPISMQPMRRPVLPSSGQAYDEISIVRYCKSGKKKCPVSGSPLKMLKNGSKVSFTIDFALRKFITTQAAYANVFVPSTDKASLLRELADGYKPEAAKAVVDDCYLGYISLDELKTVLDTLTSKDVQDDERSHAKLTCRAIVAESLASRKQDLCNLAVEYMAANTDLWWDKQVLQEALAVGQDPDCRGEVLVMLEAKVQKRLYGVAEMRSLLGFETENVPVQQFQCRIAEQFIGQCGRSCKATHEKDFVPIVNQALRVREDLDGVSSGVRNVEEIWTSALLALKRMQGTLDEACLHRLFWRENVMVLQHLTQSHQDLLMWHLKQHEGSLSLCIQTIAEHPFIPPHMGDHDDMYSSEEDYSYSDDDETGY